MKFDLSNVSFSRNDVNWNIKLPKKLNPDLAYLIGVQIGDGCLRKGSRKQNKSVEYSMGYDGHHINDREWYELILKNLIKKLFNKDVKLRSSNKGTVTIRFRSKAIFTFLNKVCNISESPKTNIKIPNIIFNSDEEIKRAFLRGLADTDFSLTFKRREKKAYYPVIDFQTNSKSLHKDTKKLVQGLGFRAVAHYRKSVRYEKVHDSYYIQISGRDQLKKWMEEVNPASFNHITRYLLWKKFGSFPPGLNINERRTMLRNMKGHNGPINAPSQTRTDDL
jgi:intein/homing endonuclease